MSGGPRAWKRAIHVCIPDDTPKPQGDNERCRKVHTHCPDNYLGWHEWAARKRRTHKQQLCLYCGLWAIWVPKERRFDDGTRKRRP